jgi:hypothetical protein
MDPNEAIGAIVGFTRRSRPISLRVNIELVSSPNLEMADQRRLKPPGVTLANVEHNATLRLDHVDAALAVTRRDPFRIPIARLATDSPEV